MAGIERSVHHEVEGRHLKLIQVRLADRTDEHNEAVQESEWLLHPSERQLALSGNLFALEDQETGSGTVFLKVAPLPGARACPIPHDVSLTVPRSGGCTVHLHSAECAVEDSWEVLPYTGGEAGRIAALHAFQAAQRPETEAHRIPRFLTNTWGDRSQDSRIEELFILAEIEAASALGADIVQIDDGWQRGVTSNSARASEAVGLEGFWSSDPRFWDVDETKFPRGLEPIVKAASVRGLEVGLWFAPDSASNFENWRCDADRILELHRLGIRHFKIDGVTAATAAAQMNLQRFFEAVHDGSAGEIAMDLDITAGVRPGYFGAMSVGPLFLENRYTDWHNYWPHHSLRNLWKLSRWIDPRRLRIEFLNNRRNLYEDDPLAPDHYPADTLFAGVMMSNPLGWFEVSSLPPDYSRSVAAVAAVWREHREALFSGTILPIGLPPDGFVWTGFASVAPNRVYILLFREAAESSTCRVSVAGLAEAAGTSFETPAGAGSVQVAAPGLVEAHIDDRFGYVFAYLDSRRR